MFQPTNQTESFVAPGVAAVNVESLLSEPVSVNSAWSNFMFLSPLSFPHVFSRFLLYKWANSSSSLGAQRTSWWAVLWSSPLGARWDLSLVRDLDARRVGGGVGPEEDRDCLEWQLLQGRSLRFRQVIRVNPLSRGGAAASTGGEEAASTSKEERLTSISGLSTPSLIRVFQHVPISTYRTPFFSVNALTFTADTLGGWKFSLLCNASSCMLRLCVWFPAILASQLNEIRVPFRAHVEAFRSCMWHLSWDSNPWAHPFFVHHYVQWHEVYNQPISLHLLVFQKRLKVSYAQSPSSLPFISGW